MSFMDDYASSVSGGVSNAAGPLKSGGGFLSSLSGGLGGLSSVLSPISGLLGGLLGGGPDPSMTPDQIANEAAQKLNLQFDSDFNVGRGTLTSDARLTSSDPTGSGSTAPAAGAASINPDWLVWGAVALFTVIILFFGARRRS